ncbi:uncharacterized protein LOC134210709 [Armigeres subalbatus]|uniref:uncharacterized protein LOC134210709 n=1 Tax=Armigeres subalbatus TaxID=124917 RepID=UPI002ECFB641
MTKISSIGSLPMVHNLEGGKPHPLEFPLINNDVTILQTATEVPCGRFDWKVLKTRRALLRMGQIVPSIVIIAIIQCYALSGTLLLFLSINALIGTLLLLGDLIIVAHPLRQAFTPVLWFKVELWFTGLVAVAFHTMAFAVFADGMRWYRISSNAVAAAFGFVNEAMYLADWWINFNNRQKTVRKLVKEQENEFKEEAMTN